MHRSRKSVRRLIDAGVGRAAESGADRVRMWAFQPNVVSVLEDGGFRPERELRQLRMTLPVPDVPRFPTSISIRSFRRGVDEDSWLEVNNAAFAGHPENGSWTKQVLEDRENQEWFDPGDFLIAWEAADLVGFCWTKRHSDTLGEIYVVAVAPAARGRGLGRTLVLEGLRHMAEVRQLTKAMLYVDADNAPALGLYEKLGFRLDHVDRSFVRDL
jgi:mycothiol synthase